MWTTPSLEAAIKYLILFVRLVSVFPDGGLCLVLDESAFAVVSTGGVGEWKASLQAADASAVTPRDCTQHPSATS